MYDLLDISKRIKSIAKKKSVGLRTMLADLGFGVNFISQMANGQATSSIALAKIADYLDVSVDYLLGRTDNPNSHKTGT